MTLRTGIIMAATAAAMAIAAPFSAHAQSAQVNTVAVTPGAVSMTSDQCKIFKGYLTDAIKVVGRENLSDSFVDAMIDFAIPRKCVGPVSVPVAGREIDIFTSISGLMHRTQGIDLRKMITPVARTASLQ